MVAPLVGFAIGAAARAVAKKVATDAAKKAAKKATAEVAKRSSVKVSSNVKVIPGKMSPTSVRASSVNEKLTSGANQARSQNTAKAAKGNTRALKAANKNVGIKYKKGYNESNYSGRNESKPKQVAKSKVRSTSNPKAPMTQPSSFKEAKSGYNTWAKANPELAKANPPSGKFEPKISRSAKANKKSK